MATLAENMFEGALQRTQQPGPLGALSQGYHQGAELAMKQEELQQRQMQLQMNMQQLQNAKAEKMMSMYETGTKMEPKAQNIFFGKQGFFRQARDNMNMKDMIPDSGLDLLVTTPEGVAKGYGAINDYRAKKANDPTADPNAVWAQITNPMTQAEMQPYYPEMNKMLSEATKERQGQQTQLQKAQLEVEASKNNKMLTLNHQDQLAAMQELGKFGTAVANASTRTNLGQMKAMIDAADSITQLTDAQLPPNATKEQKVAAYNALDSRQVAETVKGLDRLLSRANPTIHGNEQLSPPTTMDAFLAKWGEKVGNVPAGTKQGEFIERMMETVNRERNMNASKYEKQSQILKNTAPLAAKVYGDVMDKAIKDAASAPEVGGNPALYKMSNGKSYSAEQLRSLRANPNVNPAVAAEIDKTLGAQ